MKRILMSVAVAAGLLTAATSAFAAPLKLGVSAGPYGEILEFTAKLAAKEGIEAQVIEFTDWNMPNAALQAGDIDANNFQHQPFLDNQVKQRGYDIVSVAKSVVVPMGVYSSKVKALADLKPGASVSIPNDPTNGARALFLLAKAGVIGLKDGAGLNTGIADVANPKGIKLVELDAAQLPRSLDDVDASVITLNYAVLAGLEPKKALLLEDDQSKWNLVWAVRKDRMEDPTIKRFIALYRSPEVRQFIETRFNGSIIPTW
ncbi:D-methionine transport system substrate-binding protein [Azospirillum lipoferum]|uniref:MetQ/NlpA family ABC transporter substrate-binding protein n=1 Tax=Azospirillum lipoferum TaxID=193 RepID=A0A5A9GES5_AZOLI|nr:MULTISPECIES: MetQ/NlpA family ABC transporter substrate-binding protein [Azospirillum]KAA0592913.1 MetQ/NlpA family ABC transporter substrate-binding protein [Azospirillum lipoferum]MCP1614038.1 D-methionine transport system substrate-binding protein [Azospirillum lipoferum]MDW5537572.1 MetQ/NlpA family ABC transporter substrate-binding protein [Azospirillum sp. NL1]